MIWMYIDGLWTVIFTKRVMFCFTWLTCVFVYVFIALYSISWCCHPWLESYSKGLLIKKVLYYSLFCILFCIFLRVVDM
jgi:hypothetical protein